MADHDKGVVMSDLREENIEIEREGFLRDEKFFATEAAVTNRR